MPDHKPDTAKLTEQANRGAQASAIINHPLFNEAFEKMEARILEGWKESAAEDHEGRHNAYLMQRLLANLKEQFEHCVRTGDAASKQLLQIEKETKDKEKQS
ncbi:hypothetical protein [Methyloceanibacter caenitepidi]|uniref:Uncharacterized protein n=1 Tax=Methyloceanibacter caenitepidi TaxID=1384459 RepID=A0A0A8K201_9HYPH|nr:hypothetical protein [Methyloceanibacter caenitepidi]BAQ16920.1 hypothetical protein GL4_1464 [Methyloceanibacter caenitepidi]